MRDQQPHQVAVAHCVNGLHNDFIEGQAGHQLLGWHTLHPVHPIARLLVKQVVIHTPILQQ